MEGRSSTALRFARRAIALLETTEDYVHRARAHLLAAWIVRVGTPFNARATVSNIGPDSAPTATLQLTLNGLQLRAIHGTAVTCSPDRRRCTLTNLASKQTTTLDLSLVSSHAGHASITVTVSSTGTDPQPTNNHATATVHISRKRG
jgi:hypothetical protein